MYFSYKSPRDKITLETPLTLFLLKSVRREFERTAILRDRTHYIFRCPCRDLRLYFEGDPHRRSHQPGEMGDHLVGDARIPAHTGGIETNRALLRKMTR
jgi:hypothetical protein